MLWRAMYIYITRKAAVERERENKNKYFVCVCVFVCAGLAHGGL